MQGKALRCCRPVPHREDTEPIPSWNEQQVPCFDCSVYGPIYRGGRGDFLLAPMALSQIFYPGFEMSLDVSLGKPGDPNPLPIYLLQDPTDSLCKQK